MSVITEAIVLGATDEEMRRLNRELAKADTARRQCFGRISDIRNELPAAGGTKGFYEPLWAAAFNYLAEDEIAEAVVRAWGGPLYGVAIVTQAEEGDWRMLIAPKPNRYGVGLAMVSKATP